VDLLVDPRAGGQCNIGPAEIARRRRGAIALTIATLVVAAALFALAAPHVARAVLWPVAAAAGVTWLQVIHRFCVRFGALGVENFGPLGAERPVAREQLGADRRRALRLVGEGMLAGLLVTVAFMALPL
jgi:hypothetical protein